MFWLVPIFYPFTFIPQAYKSIYEYNPVAALVLALRNILLEAMPPRPELTAKFLFSSVLMLALGLLVFRRLKRSFYDYL